MIIIHYCLSCDCLVCYNIWIMCTIAPPSTRTLGVRKMQIRHISVLLIEDDEDDYLLVRQLISSFSCSHCSVEWTANYASALESLQRGQHDLCLLDYRLGGRNGLDLLREAQRLGIRTPFVFLTGHGDYALDLEAMKAGAADYLAKDELNATLLERSIRYAIEHSKKEEEILRAKRVIQTLSECNDTVIRIKDEEELLGEICRIAVEVGGYRMAWVGYAEDGDEHLIKPVAKYGYEDGYLETVNTCPGNSETGKRPITKAIQSGLPCILRSIPSTLSSEAWMAEALRRGYVSIISLPLKTGEHILGALSIKSSQSNAFDKDEVEFLLKLAGNLSYGIEALRGQKARVRAEELLAEAYVRMENRVIERTAELARANTDLKSEIEERERLEGVLRESEQKFKALFQLSPEALSLASLDEGCIYEANEAFCRLFGFSKEEIIGRTSVEIGIWPYLEERQAIMGILDSGESVRDVECHMAVRYGDIKTVQVSIELIELHGRQSMLVVTKDITERKIAEEERLRVETQLRQAQKMEAIGTLAGGIAHDFNNILAIIFGYCEMGLTDVGQYHPLRRCLEQILSAAHRARDLVKQILAFSRQGERQDRQAIELSTIVKETIKLLRASLPSSIEIRQDVKEGIALVDPTQIHQVILNLSTNAAYAMNDHGVLTIALDPVIVDSSALPKIPSGEYLRLSVSDTGLGIDPAILDRIFEPYFTTKEIGKGTGLGLAVVHGIVKRHEGGIVVNSQPGKGTIFEIYLPQVENKPCTTTRAAMPLPEGRERILVVDDEETLSTLIAGMLGSLGYSVTCFTNGLTALARFRSEPDKFDLIITDHTMPHISGTELALEAFQIRADIPVILCTGFSEKVTAQSVSETGIRKLVMKPFDRRTIAEVVRNVLDS